jgi:hypothetical protein
MMRSIMVYSVHIYEDIDISFLTFLQHQHFSHHSLPNSHLSQYPVAVMVMARGIINHITDEGCV